YSRLVLSVGNVAIARIGHEERLFVQHLPRCKARLPCGLEILANPHPLVDFRQALFHADPLHSHLHATIGFFLRSPPAPAGPLDRPRSAAATGPRRAATPPGPPAPARRSGRPWSFPPSRRSPAQSAHARPAGPHPAQP